jgi:hypothetical protein
LGGLALMVLPTLIAGNELFILGSVVLVVGAWFLAHRHGHLRGQVSASALNLNRNPNLPHPGASASSRDGGQGTVRPTLCDGGQGTVRPTSPSSRGGGQGTVRPTGSGGTDANP